MSIAFPSLPAEPVFDHSGDYSRPYEWIGVNLPRTGTRVQVANTRMHGAFMQVLRGQR